MKLPGPSGIVNRSLSPGKDRMYFFSAVISSAVKLRIFYAICCSNKCLANAFCESIFPSSLTIATHAYKLRGLTDQSNDATATLRCHQKPNSGNCLMNVGYAYCCLPKFDSSFCSGVWIEKKRLTAFTCFTATGVV